MVLHPTTHCAAGPAAQRTRPGAGRYKANAAVPPCDLSPTYFHMTVSCERVAMWTLWSEFRLAMRG